VVNAAPVLGAFAARRGFGRLLLRHGGSPHEVFSEDELRIFVGQFSEPERARASSLLYRSYLRAFARAMRRPYTTERLATPTLLLFGTGDHFVTRTLIPGWEAHADEMRVEIVPGCGHFIVDERPELVIERARSHFAG
jgi:pimeloyl-ACP methyl ester carboxylesterase